MKKEMKVKGKETVTINVESALSKIKAVCEKVEKATDSYKNVMYDVYILHKNKVHKEENCNFYVYMNKHTGMSENTAKGLVRVQQHIEKMCDVIANNIVENVESITKAELMYRHFMKNCTMRQLLTMAKYEGYFTRNLIEVVVERLENGEITADVFGNELKAAFDTIYGEGLYCIEDKEESPEDKSDVEESPKNKDKADADSEEVEDLPEDDTFDGSDKYTLQSESDLYQMEEILQGLLNEGRKIIVIVRY